MNPGPDAPARIPRPALLLGWAGVLPFGTLAAAILLGAALPFDAALALVSYGAVILSFMGGAEWGLATRMGPDGARSWTPFLAAVAPALLAWAMLALPFRPACLGLMAGFGLLLAYDLRVVRRGGGPAWYGRLRIQLTAAVLVLLAAAAAA